MKKVLCRLIFALYCVGALLQAEQKSLKINDEMQASVLDSLYPPIEQDKHFWLRADLLYFLPKEKSIVLTNENTNLFTTANVALQPDVETDFKWSFGSRVGFGYLFSNGLWDMTINWTRFHTSAQQCRSTQGNIGLGMFPIWSLADDIIPFDWVSTAKMHWNLTLNLVDLDFGRSFSWRDQFFLHLLMGIRVALIDQDLDVRYGGGIFANGLNLAALGSTFGYDSIDMKNNFWGFGPRLGIEPQLNLSKGLRLYAMACVTPDYGFFDVHQKEIYLQSIRYQRNCSNNGFRWMIDAAGGILWKTFCRERRYALTFALGWEYHIFFDQVELKGDRFGLVSDNRNLSLNGLAFSACFDF